MDGLKVSNCGMEKGSCYTYERYRLGCSKRVGHSKRVYKKRYSINRHRVGWLAKQGLNHYYANKDCKSTLIISMKFKDSAGNTGQLVRSGFMKIIEIAFF